MLIEALATYEEIYAAFRWQLPKTYNIAADVCDRHAEDPAKVALIVPDASGGAREMTFLHVQRQANRLANLLLACGLQRGDRVMLLLAQDPMTAIAYVACWKAGLVAVPTSVLFGPDAVAYRLENSGARILFTDRSNWRNVAAVRADATALERVFLIDGTDDGAENLAAAMERASDSFTTLATRPDDPAFINYTSGTTGWPKGALQGHRSMLGHMPGLEMLYDFFPHAGDLMWSPADWSWLAGLMDVLMPAWFVGIPVLVHRSPKFDAEEAFRLIGRHKVRLSLLTPTMLKLMRQVPDPIRRFDARLRCIISGSESVGRELLDWAGKTLGAVNEGFGQTECNITLGNCAKVMESRIGSLGKQLPGHVAAIVDDDGRKLPPGTVGNLAFRRPDPVMLLEYWRNPEATKAKYAGDWLLTGDLAEVDADAYFWFRGRADDVITSAGYRIGPSEIEDALVRHPAVAIAAAIGVPDAGRTEIIKAFIVLAKDHTGTPELAEEISGQVATRLARHERPREIEFVDALPMTTNGKILRRVLRDQEKAKRAAGGGAASPAQRQGYRI